METGALLVNSLSVGSRVATVFQQRLKTAQQRYWERIDPLYRQGLASPELLPALLSDPQGMHRYAVDLTQRSVLFWETLWKRGNHFIDRARDGFTPVLHFQHETVLDARQLERPVNYALLRIVPPAGVTVDPKRRPYLIIDPRAGHGPGIGGFKDDSEVGVVLRAGHAVYFVIFFRDPQPGQTLLDVCAAEQLFLKKVRSLHPDSPKPAVVGNCQGGWAAMMLAVADPEDTGPIVINGAPMSYWSGSWSEGEGDNPMRYAAGMQGGTWLASLAADLGNGVFDGAHLVQNFENLNPANSFWDKYYHLLDKADTESPRFLDFERWWGGYYLMNREEIEWIASRLFVGNRLWSGDTGSAGAPGFDLRSIRSPIILFASMGDNITPPQQAFNWVLDVYGSTEEIKARGQVIVGLKHESIGHLGIFVSSKVALKEHAQIVSVLKSIERLPPGLYSMSIIEGQVPGDPEAHRVEFQERRLEDIAAKLNRYQRVDERPFEAVAAVSGFNQRAYELFLQPVVQSLSNDASARWLQLWHPLRVQNWSVSRLNPWLSWVAPAAEQARAQRARVPDDHPWRQMEHWSAQCISASLDHWRAVRDAATEATFFSVYAPLFALCLGGKQENRGLPPAAQRDPRELPVVRQALDGIAEGGYAEALARVAALLAEGKAPLPLSRVEMRSELMDTYAEYLPALSPHRWRSIRGVQDIIARLEPERALATLPTLLSHADDRIRLLTLLDMLSTDRRVLGAQPTPPQLEMLDRIRALLVEAKSTRRRVASGSAAVQPLAASTQPCMKEGQ
ncbi:DUF3141 domain-containing protein [Eleftheria terrae]|uniref:DUF3141 domain-containing protein n=1 Tax=Eleftheria terrae TaxID=1597781 RepID=UPI00263A4560|nr:DUF3141 domain-containing protein [Eleftheria terrae]WKB55538.1 DUF3141 domain-containing protein [Eleftheria terrae]